MILLGHRGARKYAPENTIAAFEQALEHGCDGFEFDVRITADRQAVVCHDPKLCGLTIARTTRQKLLESAAKKSKEISSLEQVLRFGQRAFLNVELKTPGAEELLLELMKKHPATKGIIVSSFLPKVVVRLHELGSECDVGIICGNHRELLRWKRFPAEAVMLHRGLATQRLIEEIKSSGKRVFVWTVNSVREMKKFAELDVDGIISDDTKLLVKTLGA